MTVTTDQNRISRENIMCDHPVKAGEKIPGGVIVALNSAGLAVNGSDLAGALTARLISAEEADNTLGGNGDVRVLCYRKGDFKLKFASGVSAADVGKKVYCVDNDTVNFASATTNDIETGSVSQIIDGDYAWVDIEN